MAITDWASKETGGRFKRAESAFRDSVKASKDAKFPAEGNGRYRLYVSLACPWAHRTLIVRDLKGLQDVIPVTVVHWEMLEGGWKFSNPEECPGTTVEPYGHKFLKDLYFKADPDYSGRYTVPTLWDSKQSTIVNNESSEIIRMLYTEFDEFIEDKYKGVTYYPTEYQSKIDEINPWMLNNINNGVYKTGFAVTQEAYEESVYPLFEALDKIEEMLKSSKGKYLLGDVLTELDIRLYTTIIRFDVVYVQHFKTNIRSIRYGYPHIHKWLRNMYWDHPAFKDTTNFEHTKKHYTKSHKQINPHSITPVGPIPYIEPKSP